MEGIKQAVILAGGEGIRLRPLTLTTPKPMIKILNKPFLEYIIELLKKNDIKEVLILVGYLHEQIENYFKDGKKLGLKIKYFYSPVEDDTGTRLRKAKHLIDNIFLLLYADNYWPLKLPELSSFYKKMKTQGLVTVYSNLDNYTKNNIGVGSSGLVEAYDKKRKKKNLNGVDIGFFILNKKVLDLIPSNNCSFEEIVFPKLIDNKQLAGFLTHHKYYGLSSLGRVPGIEEFFKNKKVVFLDRDGVINKKPPKADYIKSWQEFKFLPKAKEALKLLSKKGYEIYIVSNQAGIARGVLTKKQADTINNRLKKELAKIGVSVGGIYVCPHGWDEGCFCRKPAPGLFFQAASGHHLNLYESYCIGDDPRDIMAGKLAGCKVFLATPKNNLYSIINKLP